MPSLFCPNGNADIMAIMDIEILPVGAAENCQKILKSLPEWFGNPEALDMYVAHAARSPMVVVTEDDDCVGFISISEHFGNNCEIYSMGVRKSSHRKGLGKAMVRHLRSYALNAGFSYISVKTLSANHPDPHYEATRQFYSAVGFEPFEELPLLWGESLPCLVMVLPLNIA